MIKFEFKFYCLDGNYKLSIDDNHFTIETNIDCLSNNEGNVDDSFYELLNKAHIENWDKEYTNSNIDDHTNWYVRYQLDNKVYVSSGEETCIPYGYQGLVNAIKLLDNKADYFSY